MSHEKEIPAYAMQPARAPQIVQSLAVYHKSHMTVPLERQKATYQFEEDILVPDIKDDMAEILLMEADCDIMPEEKRLLPKTDDLLNFTGTITIQTLYQPDKEDSLPVAITSKVPYKYQWNFHCTSPAEGSFNCRIKSLEYMIINERKFRAKVTLEFTAYLYEQKELSFFQALEDEPLETKVKEVGFNCLAAILKEETILETRIESMDLKEQPVQILWQHYTMTENYRQVTTEKVVLNGFVYIDFLYLGRTEEQNEVLCHKTERVEFTQFIPLGKEYRGRKWSLVKVEFRNQGLNTVIEKQDDGTSCFRVTGSLQSCVSLYEENKKEMVVDAYHLKKEFTCRFQKQTQKCAAFSIAAEVPVRDVIHLPDGSKAESALCCRCRPVHWKTQMEKNRMILTGSLQIISLWRDAEQFHTVKSHHDFQQSIEVEGLEPNMQVDLDLFVRDCRLTFLNEKQMEISCSLMAVVDGYCEKELVFLDDPAFVEGRSLRHGAMVITAVEPEETLWDLAKRHRTTREQISEINHLEGEPKTGQKLLIIK
ncbi:MAG: DUF3794 domain-containing protein [Firmicutes bacterium]|nr:DUF3794 domain-containing protein [Bacillota bacterium]